MKNSLRNISKLALLALAGVASVADAQMSSAIYFLDQNPVRHHLNPAYKPKSDTYIGMPGLSNVSFSAGNNVLDFSDVFQNVKTADGKTQTVFFLDSRASDDAVDNVLDKLKNKNFAFADYRVSLLEGGFYSQKMDSYLTVGLSTRSEGFVAVPKNISRLALGGMNEGENFDSKLDKMSVDISLFSEFAFGVRKQLSEKWGFGAKVKYLYGHANVHTDFSDLSFKGNAQKWTLKGDANVNFAIPGLEINEKTNGHVQNLDFDDVSVSKLLKPQGHGLAIDLGADYACTDNLKLSASVLDFGFIHWGKSLKSVYKNTDVEYDGIEYDINDPNSKNIRKYFHNYKNDWKNLYKVDQKAEDYNTMLATKVLLSADYAIIDDKLSVGALSKSYIYRSNVLEEALVAATYKPLDWLQGVVTYHLFDGEWNNIGLGLNFNAGPVNVFAAVDGIALNYAKTGPLMIPSEQHKMRASLGVNFLFGDDAANKKKKGEFEAKAMGDNFQLVAMDTLSESKSVGPNPEYDKDLDGVPDSLDYCPDTPLGVEVDMNGCPFDSDNDGVPDYLDRCPNTPAGYVVDAEGCTDLAATVAKRMSDSTAVSDSAIWQKYHLSKVNNQNLPSDVQDLLNKATYGIRFFTGDAMGIETESYELLNKIAVMMRRHKDYYLYIENHVNLIKQDHKLSEFVSRERAQLIRRYLILRGVSPQRIATKGVGAHKRIATDRTVSGRQQNRRSVLTIWRQSGR